MEPTHSFSPTASHSCLRALFPTLISLAKSKTFLFISTSSFNLFFCKNQRVKHRLSNQKDDEKKRKKTMNSAYCGGEVVLDSFKRRCWSSSSCLKNSRKIIIITTAMLSILYRSSEKKRKKRQDKGKENVQSTAELKMLLIKSSKGK